MISGIHVSSSEMVIHTDDAKKNKLPSFIENQIIHAKVLKRLPHGSTQLLINGQKVVAKTAMLLNPGEEVQLKVLAQKDAVVLKLIGPVQKMTPTQISSLIQFFSKNEVMPDITETQIKGVKKLLYGMALKSETPDDQFLPKLIENSGLLWEKKVAQLFTGSKSSPDIRAGLDALLNQDMKGTLMKALLTADPQKFEALKTAAAFSETLENFQLLNHQSSESGRFLLPFPVFTNQTFSLGQLLIDMGDKTKRENSGADSLIQISFLLNMTQLGPLRADFSILKKEITGRFLLQDDDTCDYVRSMIPGLKRRLATIDYNVHQIECHTGTKAQIQKSSFIENVLNVRGDQVLNIVV